MHIIGVSLEHNSLTIKSSFLQYEAKIQSGNEKFVHHIVFHGCTQNMSQYLNTNQQCYDTDDAKILMQYCTEVLLGWAVGADVCCMINEILL